MRFLLQECVVRGKQIQVPILGERYKTSSGWRHGSGGWIDLNVCTPRDAKLGHALAEEIAKILSEHGYQFEYVRPQRKRKPKAVKA